jgi:hypothetical protein
VAHPHPLRRPPGGELFRLLDGAVDEHRIVRVRHVETRSSHEVAGLVAGHARDRRADVAEHQVLVDDRDDVGDVLEQTLRALFTAPQRVFGDAPLPAFPRPLERREELLRRHRLHEIVARVLSQGADGAVDRRVAREHDGFGHRRHLMKPPDDLHAVHVRQLEIDERNRGKRTFNTDLSVFKRTAIGKTAIEVRIDVFNLFDRAHFANPNTTLGNAAFGRISATRLTPREAQVGVRFLF